ncbi:MAG: tetratricopeptide repeat protein [Nitrospinaceae bacterium]
MSLLGVFLLIFAACAMAPDIQAQRDQARQEFEKASRFQSLKKTDAMLDRLREAVRLDPGESLYQLTLGNALFSLKKLDEAEIHFKAAVNINPRLTEAYRQLGRLYMQRGDWKNAEAYLQEALAQPGMARPHELYNWLALTQYAQGRFTTAEKQWKDALKIKDNFEIRLNLARAYRDHELFDLAQASLEKALDLEPDSARVHFELAQLYLKKRRFPAARQHLNQVIRLEPLGEMSKTSRQYLKMMPSENNHGG